MLKPRFFDELGSLAGTEDIDKEDIHVLLKMRQEETDETFIY